MSINAAAIADAWNEPIPELNGTPLSKSERAYAEGRTYCLSIVLKNGGKKSMQIVANRGVDAFLEMMTTAEEEGWDEDMKNIDIEDITERFE